MELRNCKEAIQNFWVKVMEVKEMHFPKEVKIDVESFISEIAINAADVAMIGNDDLQVALS